MTRTRTTRRTTVLLAVATAVVVGLGVPAAAAPPVQGPVEQGPTSPGQLLPPDRPAPPPPPDPVLQAQVLRSFTADRLSVPKGSSVTFQWSLSGPSEGVTLELDGEPVPYPTGLRLVPVHDRDERHVLTVHRGGAQRTLGTLVVGANPCPAGARPVGQCGRPGRIAADYERRHESFAFNAADLQDPGRPGGRLLHLDTCATDPGRHGRVEHSSWVFQPRGPGGGPAVRHHTAACRSTVSLLEGEYSATVSARTANGAVLTRRLPVTVKDLFVVSIGDSYASGEGNPDVDGDYTSLGFRVPGGSAAKWQNEPCHRSAWSGHAVAAKELSKDRHTGLNFLSLACTGAEARHLVYEAKGSAQPQLSVLRRTLCEWEPCRPVDLLTVSVGGNDIGFAAVAEACVINTSPHASCSAALGRAEQAVGTLVSRIRSVQQAIQDSGLTVRRVLLVGYPARVFEGGSVCARHGARLVSLGNRMEQEQKRAVDTLRSQRWHYVAGVTEAFAGKGYCSTTSLLRRPLESNAIQGDTDGTAHPNLAGHRAIAARIVETSRAVLRSQGTGGVLAR